MGCSWTGLGRRRRVVEGGACWGRCRRGERRTLRVCRCRHIGRRGYGRIVGHSAFVGFVGCTGRLRTDCVVTLVGLWGVRRRIGLSHWCHRVVGMLPVELRLSSYY